MQDLAAALEGVTTVLVTHDRRFIRLGTHHLDLGAAPSA